MLQKLAGALPLTVLLVAGCGHEKGTGHESRAGRVMPVEVIKVITRDMPVTITSVGTVASPHTVTVSPQVTGMLSTVMVHSGQTVKAGQVLFHIDPLPFYTALREAEAKLAGDRAQQVYTATQLASLRPLVAKDYVTRQSFEQARAAAVAAAAQVEQDRYAVESARIALAYTTIHAPISGRLGAVEVKSGNVVQASNTALVTINQMDPMDIDFSVPQSTLSSTRRALLQRQVDNVAIYREADQGRPLGKGRLDFVDNNVAATTGTVALKARAENPQETLWPGQFVVVRLTLRTMHHARVVPAGCVQQGQQGPFVYVVRNRHALVRKVALAFIEDHLAVIRSGLQPGEMVVDPVPARMRPDSPVKIISARALRVSKPSGHPTELKGVRHPTPEQQGVSS